MIFSKNKSPIYSALLLCTVALLPLGPMATNSAYQDIETSLSNGMRAGEGWEEQVFRITLDEFSPQSLSVSPPEEASDLPEPEGEVAGVATEEPAPEGPVVEISEPIVDITPPAESQQGSTLLEEPAPQSETPPAEAAAEPPPAPPVEGNPEE